MTKELKTMLGDIKYTTSLNEYDIDVICEYIKEKANKKELHNRNGACDMEVIGFVHGLRWTISYLKSLKG